MADQFNKTGKDQGRIEELKKGLYSRDTNDIKREEALPRFKQHSSGVRSDWQDGSGQAINKQMSGNSQNSIWMKRLFASSIIFFIISVGVAAFMMLGGGNVISSKNVDIAISGPVSIDAGKELSIQIEVQNQNNTTLEGVDLVIDYPEGARNSADLGQELKRYRESIGDILPGQTATKRISTVLFGEEGAVKTIAIEVEYRVAGSNALLNKKKTYEIAISSAPVSITIDSLSEVNAGQEVEFVVNVVSNSNNAIQNVLLNVDYPFGFEFVGAVPQPSYNNVTWNLGTLKPEEKRIIKVRGKIEGQDGEERAFRFTIGTANPKQVKEIGIPFITTLQSLTIQKPFLGVELAVNGDSGKTHVTEGGREVRADISWTNNTSVRIIDAKIEVKLKGTIFEKTSISTEGGFYRSIDNTIVWDQTNTRGFDVLGPGANGRVSFTFKVLDLAAGGGILKNPEMQIEISASGKRIDSSNVPETITSSVVRKIQLATKVGLLPRVVYNVGPFVNTGPLPPRADQETTYTIMWTLTNPSNDANSAVVTATLPSYIRWIGEISPSDASVRYNPATGEVSWNAGTIPAGAGYSGPAREVAFRIGFIPSVTQIGTKPVIMGASTATAEDSFTKTKITTVVNQPLTTDLPTDPAFGSGQGTVAK